MTEEDLVAFFRSLPPSRRREYDALAERDRRHGEDVESDGSNGRADEKKRTSENLS